MDDFENDELYDDDYYNQIEEDDDGDGESLKDKYDRAKEYKEKFDEYKEKYNKHKNKSTNNTSKNAGKELGKKQSKEGAKQAGKESSKQAAKQAGKKGAKQAAKQAGKEGAKQAGKEAAKQAAKQGAKVAAKRAVQGAASSTGYGVIIAVAIEVADILNKIKKKIDKKADKAIEEATGVKDFSKKKKFIPILLIIATIMLIFIIPAMAMYSVSETASSELTTLVKARELTKEKDLIFFTNAEIKELLNKNIEVDETIATKLAEEGYTLEKKENGKYESISYKNILKAYGNDLTTVFAPNDLTGASTGMEDVLEDGTTYDSLSEEDKYTAVSTKNVRKYLLAEIENFNKGVKWQTRSLKTNYVNIKSENFSDYSSYLNAPKVMSDGTSSIETTNITNMNYTVLDESGNYTMLKMPRLSSYGVDVGSYGGENKAAMTIVQMISPYMQKWIIPYSMYIDTQDEAFVDSVMKNVYHPVDVAIFKLQKVEKTSKFEYYMECNNYKRIETKVCDDNGMCTTTTTEGGKYGRGQNTRDNPIGEEVISTTVDGNKTVTVYEVTEISKPYKIAKDADGNPIVKKIKTSRRKLAADSIPEVVNVESFYDMLYKEYTIMPVNENNVPDATSTSELDVNDNTGIGNQTLVEEWKEALQLVNSESKKYKVSYYTDEQLEELGRNISRVEWYQDTNNMVSGGIEASAGGINQTQQEYIDKFKEDAINDMNQSGVLASLTLAQGILEGGSGTSSLAADYNNHFGIKAGTSWTGNIVMLKTGEYDSSGNYYTINAAFRAYDSAADSFADHSKFIWNTRGHSSKAGGYRYRDCTEFAKEMTYTAPDGQPTYDYRSAIQAVVSGGYCTDPSYVSKICNIIETYKLYELDRQSTWDGTAPAYATADVSGGAGGGSVIYGGGTTLYSYDDMYFAYNQIEKWYTQSGGLTTSTIMGESKFMPGDEDTVTTLAGTFPKFRQIRPAEWASWIYYDNTISYQACGPTSISIALSGLGLIIPGYDGAALRGKTNSQDGIMTPPEVCAYSLAVGGHVASAGMSWAFPGKVMQALGIEYEEFGHGQAAQVLELLKEGYAGVASSKTGYFTGGGHIISVVGANPDDGGNTIGIVDPAGPQRDGFYTVDQLNDNALMPAGVGRNGRRNANIVKWWVFKYKNSNAATGTNVGDESDE